MDTRMRELKTHAVEMVLGYAFKTPCGKYLDGTDKERVEANTEKVTCENCRKTKVFLRQDYWERMQRRIGPSEYVLQET